MRNARATQPSDSTGGSSGCSPIRTLFFSATGEEGKVYQLYLFDMDGRLVSQTRIRSRETTVLTNISEGNFLFEVFTDDERIENGQLTVR